MSNHFKIIVPLYNVQDWIDKCIKSIKLQEYKNYQVFLIDDMSTDGTANKIKEAISDDDRFIFIQNKEKKLALRNIYEAIMESGSDDEDIIVTLDGDDWLATKKALNVLHDTYDKYKCHMTYGSYLEYPAMKKGTFCQQIPENIIKNNSYRENRWVSSHLRTFKRHLWNRIKIQDLLDDDGNFYKMTWDMAFMFPMLEMAGPLAVHIPHTLYSYNRQNPLNDDKVNHKLQLTTEQKIRNKKRYKQNFVTCNILGPGPANSGLGNQLFCVANVLSYAKDFDKLPYFPQIEENSAVKKYQSVFYKNLNVGLSLDIHTDVYREKSFSYDKIPQMQGNILLGGYFQSSKYFDHNRDYILDCLNIEEKQEEIKQEYGDYSDYIGVHVRRGDYLKLKNYHNVLELEYYKMAMKHFGEDQKYIMFSDDIEWCKKNFNFISNVLYSKCKEDWQDMLLMSTCEKGQIIANSTFSWWSAWISNAEVVAPKKWFANSINTKDLYPTKWKTL